MKCCSSIFIAFLLISISTNAQTIIWSEDFDGNSGSGSNWGTLNQNIGIQGATANQWYISCQENGNSIGSCGTGCGTDNSLHVGSSNAGDIGAAYEIGCQPGCIFCDFFGICINSTTNKRSQSANINTTGQTNLTLNFNYIELGQGTTDDCIVEYSINGGTSWLTLTNTPKPALGICAPQGRWTAFSIALPAACENISNLRIAFKWQNDADGAGSDPSFAVNDITITKPAVLPIELLYFNGEYKNNKVFLEWSTSTEINNAYFTIERSIDAHVFTSIGTTQGVGNSNTQQYYQFIDDNPFTETKYYRLKQTDFNGASTHSNIVVVNNSNSIKIYHSNNQLIINTNSLKINATTTISIYNMLGQEVYHNVLKNASTISTSQFNSGIYIIKIGNNFVKKMKF